MAVTADIVRSWRDPRGTLRARLAGGVREDRALATAMGACLLMFLAQLPRLARAAYLDPSVPLDARIGGALLAMLFLVPVLLYGVAAVSHAVLRAMGRPGTAFGARMALFWSLLVTSPLILLHGLLSGLVGPGVLASGAGVAVLLAFLVQWGAGLAEAGLWTPGMQG